MSRLTTASTLTQCITVQLLYNQVGDDTIFRDVPIFRVVYDVDRHNIMAWSSCYFNVKCEKAYRLPNSTVNGLSFYTH